MKAAILLVLVSTVACGKKEKGDPLGLPMIKPPVTRNLPSGLTASGTSLTQTSSSSPLKIMGSRIFDPGPVAILDRLDIIDQQIASLNALGEKDKDPPSCTTADAIAWTLPGQLPANASFPMYLQCSQTSEQPTGTGHLGFGKKDDYFYLVSVQQSAAGAVTPNMITMVKARLDGTRTEVWLNMQNFDLSQTKSADDYMWLSIVADDASKGFEAAVGGIGKGFGVDCGVRVKSNGANVYGEGVFSSFGGLEDCSGVVDASNQQQRQPASKLCADVATLAAADSGACAALTTFSLPHLGREVLGAAKKAESDKFVGAKITGIAPL